ncbi:hypothetical protein J1N35_011601 [Gossypium stocksii]|uniref:Reverse transcriptase domain-containing protein n=1 Tax=Gossypium stocksii TaxID=47602 RepID=A0A9D4ADC8_9ROSI|nr:hypothetical protein J1N35_011601 [Gossypium stocksii]
MRNKIKNLQEGINKVIDSEGNTYEGNNLKEMRSKLGNLLDKEEQYWIQQSRVSWLKEGDRNTQFFHARATNRKKKNNIARLKDINGHWRENTTDICMAIREYFQRLFKSNLNSNSTLNLDYIDRCIPGEANDKLLKNFTDNEIKEAFNQMDPRKALGIDGLSGNFFIENWDVVRGDVLKLCHDILRGDKNVDCLNDTTIVLIPKIKELVDMTNFRPIRLYRVVYKIMAKVLANRLKETLPLCISQNQSAFVPERMIHDNILIAHELVHYLHKGFVIKLDISKAYDRVEWTFIEEVMKKMGYANEWVTKIMSCVRSIRYVVKCNSILSETIVPERGLRQGDPLSPFLLLFYMEAFSKLLIHAQTNNILKGIRASINGPRINHLFFADDALLFIRNKKMDVEEIANIMASFSHDSGQEINKDKSMIMFSTKTPEAQKDLFSSMLGMRIVDKLDNYLGLPLPVGRKNHLLSLTSLIGVHAG